MRYIYFEVHKKSNHKGWVGTGSIQNLNILLLRPINLNSVGVWGFGHVTESRNGSDMIPKSYTEWGKSYNHVDQYWVDVQVYRNGEDVWVDKAIQMAKMLFREVDRESKINLIGI